MGGVDGYFVKPSLETALDMYYLLAMHVMDRPFVSCQH